MVTEKPTREIANALAQQPHLHKPTNTQFGRKINQDALNAGIILLRAKETRQWLGFDLTTGNHLYTTESENSWMMYSRGVEIKDDKFYTAGYGGEIYAYDLKTGTRLWTSQIDPEGLESVYERAPLSAPTVVDGKLYVYTQEHSMTHPYYRTWKMYCFNIENGERIWDITGAWKQPIFADGYLATTNLFDMQVYSFGKGPTTTTVTATPSTGDSIIIQGKVIDISAGTKQDGPATRFPDGVPAVSEQSMTEYMEYLYMQQPKPNDTTGVQVQLTAIAPDNTEIDIGTITTDSNGKYGFAWTPQNEGTYKIIATFKGSNSYYQSEDTTYISISQTKTNTNTDNNPATPASIDSTIILSIAAIALLIAIIAIAMTFKKRK
jgi:hypothetical protein